MSLINISNLSFSYDNNYEMIFENVSFQIDTDWKLGFIGRNGKGKTTFLNILMGKYNYRGTVSSNVTFEYLPYEVKNEKLSTMEILREICPDCEEWKFLKEFSLLEIEEDIINHQFFLLSSGEKTKVLLAALFLKENNFLLIDEPTNHLDINARKIVSRYLKGKKSFILVSHDRNLLDSCIDHILSINKTNIEIQKGNFSTWEKNKRQQDELEIYQNRKLKKEIKRLVKSSKRKNLGMGDKGYIGHMAAKMMKRAKSIEKRSDRLIEEKSQLLHNIDIDEKLKLSPLIFHSKRLIEFKNVSLFYNNRLICRDINFKINQGEIISLTGKNGSGKSTILKLIIGKNVKYTGNIYCAKNLKISYVSQDTSDLKGNLFEYIEEKQIDKTLFLSILSKMGFNSLQFEKDISDYSEGQKKKILITASLCEKAHLYIWDEPLNFIDIMSRIQIEELILNYRPTLLFVEHDELFNKKVADRFINL